MTWYRTDPTQLHGNTVHGYTSRYVKRPLEYNSWLKIKSRCFDKNNNGYQNYGGRGITVCARWLGEAGFANFYADMGPRPTPQHSLDRIDNDGNYEPGNCRWATRSQQTQNRRPSPFEWTGRVMFRLRQGGMPVPEIAQLWSLTTDKTNNIIGRYRKRAGAPAGKSHTALGVCKRGHPWVAENIVREGNRSKCRLCRNLRAAHYAGLRRQEPGLWGKGQR